MTELPKLQDLDPTETQEWLESIDSVLKTHGAERAHFLLERLIDHTRRSGAYLPFKPNTAYVNTIPVTQEKEYPGDRALERRIEAYLRWNSVAMVLQGQQGLFGIRRTPCELRLLGHLVRSRLQSFLARGLGAASRRHGVHAGTFLAGHLCARFSGGPVVRRPAEPLPPGSRRSRSGPVILSASVADARLLAVPHGVHGLGTDDGDLPGALRALHGTPRPGAADGSQGVVLPGRW